MSYRADKCCQLKIITPSGAGEVRAHEDRGDGTAQCAVGTQYPDPTDWDTFGPEAVDCLLCAQVRTASDERIVRRGRGRAVLDPGIAMSLDERIARIRARRAA